MNFYESIFLSKNSNQLLKNKNFKLKFEGFFWCPTWTNIFFFQFQTIKNEKLFLLNTLCWAENTLQIPAEVINFMSSLLSFPKYVRFIYPSISLEKKLILNPIN